MPPTRFAQTLQGWRGALTRGPHPCRRDRAERLGGDEATESSTATARRHSPTEARTAFGGVDIKTSAYRPILGAFLGLTLALASVTIVAPASVDAASCVRISGGRFDAPGNDASNLNGEYVKIKNCCSTRASISGWKLHDYGKKNTYTFRIGAAINPGVTVTVYSGKGTQTSTKKYWGRSSGEIWNNTQLERAYLRNTAGTLKSRWPASVTPTPTPKPPSANCHPSYEGACLTPGIGDYDCAGGSGNGPNYVAGPILVVGWDEFGLDGDGDGIGCE